MLVMSVRGLVIATMATVATIIVWTPEVLAIGEFCDCSDWVQTGCGVGCSPTQTAQTRTCNPSGCKSETLPCQATSRCYHCTPWRAFGDCNVGCPPGQRLKTRTCTGQAIGTITEGPTCMEDASCPPDSCPNGVCNAGENYTNCPADCAAPVCGDGSCNGSETNASCSQDCPPTANWGAYGFAHPGDPLYGLGYYDPLSRDLLGLAAKGNIIVGDYTSPEFQDQVIQMLTPEEGSIVQPYVIDPTDEALGYLDGYNARNLPEFGGDYNRQDKEGPAPGLKLDGAARKFFESTLSDEDFRAAIDYSDPFYTGGTATVDAVLYTNHAFAGLVKAKTLTINGTMVARDDALLFKEKLEINHDTRVLDERMASLVVLPFGLSRPSLIKLEDVQ